MIEEKDRRITIEERAAVRGKDEKRGIKAEAGREEQGGLSGTHNDWRTIRPASEFVFTMKKQSPTCSFTQRLHIYIIVYKHKPKNKKEKESRLRKTRKIKKILLIAQFSHTIDSPFSKVVTPNATH